MLLSVKATPIVLGVFGALLLFPGASSILYRARLTVHGRVVSKHVTCLQLQHGAQCSADVTFDDGRSARLESGATQSDLRDTVKEGDVVRKEDWQLGYSLNGQRRRWGAAVLFETLAAGGVACWLGALLIIPRRSSSTRGASSPAKFSTVYASSDIPGVSSVRVRATKLVEFVLVISLLGVVGFVFLPVAIIAGITLFVRILVRLKTSGRVSRGQILFLRTRSRRDDVRLDGTLRLKTAESESVIRLTWYKVLVVRNGRWSREHHFTAVEAEDFNVQVDDRVVEC